MNTTTLRIFLLTSLFAINPWVLQASESQTYSALKQELAKQNADKALLQELLCNAIASNDDETIELFFQFRDRFDINKCCSLGLTPLMMAFCVDNIELVKKLIASGADVNAVGIKNKTPLIGAIKLKRLKIAELLIQHGANVNLCDAGRYTPLIYAVENNDSEAIKLLINHSVDLDAVDETEHTALMRAAWLGHSSLVELLIENGADTSVQAKPKVNALTMALHSKKATRQTIKKMVRVILTQNHAAVMQQAYEKLEYNCTLKEPADMTILQDALHELGLPCMAAQSKPLTQTELTQAISDGLRLTGTFYSGVIYGALGGALICYLIKR